MAPQLTNPPQIISSYVNCLVPYNFTGILQEYGSRCTMMAIMISKNEYNPNKPQPDDTLETGTVASGRRRLVRGFATITGSVGEAVLGGIELTLDRLERTFSSGEEPSLPRHYETLLRDTDMSDPESEWTWHATIRPRDRDE